MVDLYWKFSRHSCLINWPKKSQAFVRYKINCVQPIRSSFSKEKCESDVRQIGLGTPKRKSI